MGRKGQLWLVYVGEGSSHSRQWVEAANEEAHISEDARPVASEDPDETQAPSIGHVFECKVWYSSKCLDLCNAIIQLWVASLQKLII